MKFMGWGPNFFFALALGCSRQPSADEVAKAEARQREASEAAEAASAAAKAKADEAAQVAQTQRIKAKSFPLDRSASKSFA